MNKYFFVLNFFIYVFLFADVPVEINYTGFLREFGQPVSGQRNVELKIYTQETGGIPIWSSEVMNINVSSGIFNCVISPNIDFRDGNFWIETVVNNKIFHQDKRLNYRCLLFIQGLLKICQRKKIHILLLTKQHLSLFL
jgi:hypothetical protein